MTYTFNNTSGLYKNNANYINLSGKPIYNNKEISIEHHCITELIKLLEEGLFNIEYQQSIPMDYNNPLAHSKLHINNIINKLKALNCNTMEILTELCKVFNINIEKHKVNLKRQNLFMSNHAEQEWALWNDIFHKILIDFLIQYAGFDKIETQRRNTITTTKSNKFETFFNYYLMDYDIVQIPKIHFNQESQKFYQTLPYDYSLSTEREYEQEITSIKRLVPFKDRHHYFK